MGLTVNARSVLLAHKVYKRRSLRAHICMYAASKHIHCSRGYEQGTLVQAATHRIRIWEVPGSNIGQGTEDP